MTQTREAFDAALPKYRFDPSSSPHEFRSPIEWTGHWFIHKVLKAEAPLPAEPLVIMGEVFPPPLAVLAVEVPIKTRMGTFFGDAVVHTPGKNTLVEYDGRTYHPDWEADDARSAAILATGLIDQIVRIDATLLLEDPGAASFILSRVHREAAGDLGAQIGDSFGWGECRDTWDECRLPVARPFVFSYEILVYDDAGEIEERTPTFAWVHRPIRHSDRVGRMLALLDEHYVTKRQDLIALHRQHFPGTGRA